MKILDFPRSRQTYDYDCGAKALQTVLNYYGIEVPAELLIKYAKTSAQEGTDIKEICKVLQKFGLKYKSASLTVKDLKNYIDKKIPVMILLQAWHGKNPDYAHDYQDGHWAVAIGYGRDRIFFEDPFVFERTFLKNKELKVRWHGQENQKPILNHGIAVFGKKPVYNSQAIIHLR